MVDYVEMIDKGTSVKSIGVLQYPTATKTGLADFIYRDQYSVFDWGAMPLPQGVSIDNQPVAVVAAFNYEMLSQWKVPVCYEGVLNHDGNVVDFQDLSEGDIPTTLRVRLVNVVKPSFDAQRGKWDYSVFKNQGVTNFVLPLEFIWREQAGEEGSFWKNIERGVYTLADFGLPANFKKGDSLPAPLLDHSSKYEDHDRYFSPAEAQGLSGLDDRCWGSLRLMRRVVNVCLWDHARQVGFDRPDGKQEFALIDGECVLADVAGTWHEDRFQYKLADGTVVKVSKQVLRDLHALRSPVWVQQCNEAKQRAEREGYAQWKDFVTERPEPLEAAFFGHYNHLMHAATNAWVGKSVFSGASPLEEACREFYGYVNDYKERLQRGIR